YLGKLVFIWLAAIVGIAASIAFPLVGEKVVDGPVRDGDSRALLLLGSLALGIGVLEALLTFLRRWAQIGPVLGLETRIRDDLYAHLQRLPMSFHGKWQSGQLLSRATTDLSTIRRFLGFGMLFLVMNILQLVTVTVLLLNMYWPLGVLVAVSAVPIIMLS